jgi:hypothetical protein
MKKYKSVQELLKDTPETVLLVGNGQTKDKGELIDSYEFVIRFNHFELSGFESHVGSKTNAISFHCSDLSFPHTLELEKNYLKYRDTCSIFTTSPLLPGSKKDILHLEKNTQLIGVSKPIFGDSETRLSSGAALALNLSLLFRKNVHIIGFDFMKSGHYWDPNWTRASHIKLAGFNTPPHNGDFDKSVLNDIKSITFL